MKIKRTHKGFIKILCSEDEAQVIACLFNTSCIHQAIKKVFPAGAKTLFKNDCNPTSNPWDKFTRVGIESSKVHTGEFHPNGNKETFHAATCLTDAVLEWYGKEIVNLRKKIKEKEHKNFLCLLKTPKKNRSGSRSKR